MARLPGARRVWTIGAVHGEASRLRSLHDRVGARLADGDRIVYLGNYLGFGSAILATLDELLDFRRRVLSRRHAFACDVVYLRGAQEEMWHKLLQLQFAPNPGAILQWMVRAGIEPTIAAYGGDLRQGFAATRDGPLTITRWTSALRETMNSRPGHRMLLNGLRHAAYTTLQGVFFVHAAVDPARPLAAQRDAFWWGETDILELSAPFESFARVVRGYDRKARGLVETDYAVSLDAGSGRGGRLIGACFDPAGKLLDTLDA